MPVTNLYATTMLDLQQGTGHYDAMVVAAFYYGDLISGKYIVPVDQFMASGQYPQWSYNSMPPSLRTLYHWGESATACSTMPTARSSTTAATS